jgi:hypothetical protein
MGIEREEGVTGPETQPGDTNPNPDGNSGGERQEREENRIPQSRVEEMWAKREAKMRKEWEEKELFPIRQRYEADQQRLVQAELARLEKMGWYTPEQPKPVTQDQIEKMFEDRLGGLEKKYREEQYQLYYTQRISDGWKEVSRKHPSLAEEKWFQDSVLAAYAENPKADIPTIADTYAKRVEAQYAAFSQRQAEEKQEQRRPDKRVMPGGRGAAGGSKGDEGKKQTVAQKLLARLQSEKE